MLNSSLLFRVPLIKANNTFDISISKVHSITTHGVIQLQKYSTQSNNDSWIFHRSSLFFMVCFYFIGFHFSTFLCCILLYIFLLNSKSKHFFNNSPWLWKTFFLSYSLLYSLVVYYLFWFIHHKFIYAFCRVERMLYAGAS